MDKIRDVWAHDGIGNALSSYQDPQGNYVLNIHDADVHNVLVNRHFCKDGVGVEAIGSAVSAGDVTIAVASTTDLADGDFVMLKDSGGDIRETYFEITSIVVDTSITLDRPVDIAYATGTIQEVIPSMNVDGSGGTLIFEVAPPSDKVWHITRVLISITDSGAMDDGLFGSLAALEFGTILRESKTVYSTLGVWKVNGDMIQDMYDIEYHAKAPAGENGLKGRFSLIKNSVALRLDGSNSDTLQILIQDDLTALTTFIMKAQGHVE